MKNIKNLMVKYPAVCFILSAVFLSFMIRVVGFIIFCNWEPGILMQEFHYIAKNIFAGNGFARAYCGVTVPSAYMPPGFCYFQAGLMYALGDGPRLYLTVLTLQALIGALATVPIYLIAKLVFDRNVAIIAVILSLGYPIFQLNTSDYTSAPFYILFNLLAIYFLLKLREIYQDIPNRTIVLYSFLGGMFFGLYAAFRGEALLFLPVPFLLIWGIRSRPKVILCGCMFVLAFLLVMGPWWVRNRIVFGEWVVTPTAGKYTLYRGQNRLATGGAFGPWMGERPTSKARKYGSKIKTVEFQDPDADLGWSPVPPETREKINALPVTRVYELEKERIYLEEALNFMVSKPLKSLGLALVKFKYFWWRDYTHPVSHHFAYYIPWAILLPFFALGLLINLRPLLTREKWMSYIFICQTLICMIFLVQPRYRIALNPFIFMIAATAMLRIFHFLQGRTTTARHRRSLNDPRDS